MIRFLLARALMEAGFKWLLAGLRPRSLGWWMTGTARRLLLRGMAE
jgi:hypothetical protein